MTKTLTEQWKDGELPSGFYYVSIPGAVCGVSILDDYELQAYKSVRDSDKIEVLSEVPSYDEYKEMVSHCNVYSVANKSLKDKIAKLQEQLKIATKALEEYERCENGSYANKALVLMKEEK